jgi:peptidoglycan/LPS O-acetylase OafA/YrhL
MEKKNKIEVLEALRGFAALYVVAHHLQLYEYSKLGYLTSQGQAAVMLFFILSGFVMYYANYRYLDEGRFRFKAYFVRRFRRIYPVFIAALLLAYVAACIEAKSFVPIDGRTLLGNLLNLQDHARIPNNWFEPYYKNGPLWSLSYEWWFYMLFFPIFKYVSAEKQKYLVLAISCIGFLTFFVYPNKISITLGYFMIWWSGVELCRSYVTFNAIRPGTILFVLGSHLLLMGLIGAQILSDYLHKQGLNLGRHPVIEFRHYFYSFTIISFGIICYRYRFKGLATMLKPFLYFAPISYGIYVFHAPFFFRYNLFGIENEFVKVFVGMTCVLLLSYLLEVRLQKFINQRTNALLE